MSGAFPTTSVFSLGRPGFIGLPTPPAAPGVVVRGAGVRITSNASLGNNNYATIAWDAVDFDIGGPFHTGATWTKLTVPVGGAGFYLANFCCSFAANATGFRAVAFRKNGASTLWFGETILSPVNAVLVSVHTAFVFNLIAGDFIEALALQNSGAPLNAVPTTTQGVGNATTFSLVNIP